MQKGTAFAAGLCCALLGCQSSDRQADQGDAPRSGEIKLTGEAYVVGRDGRVIPAAGSNIYLAPASLGKDIDPKLLAAALYDADPVRTVPPGGTLMSALQSFTGSFNRKAAEYITLVREYEGTATPPDPGAVHIAAVLSRFIAGDRSAVFDSYLTTATTARDDSISGRWPDEWKATPRTGMMQYMVRRMQFLSCLNAPAIAPSCNRLLGSLQPRAEQMAIFDSVRAKSIVSRVEIDGKFTVVVTRPGRFVLISTYETEAVRGVWFTQVTISASEPPTSVVLNRDNLFLWPPAK